MNAETIFKLLHLKPRDFLDYKADVKRCNDILEQGRIAGEKLREQEK